MMDQCSSCQKEVVKFFSVKLFLCRNCSRQNHLKKRLAKLGRNENLAKIKIEYNRFLFGLYLQYVNRYHLKYPILEQADDFLEYLMENEFTSFTTWEKIHNESMLYRQNYKVINGLTGCPFIKVGKMLAELGVLLQKNEDFSQRYVKILKRFPLDKVKSINQFIDFEKNRNILDKTIIIRLEFLLYMHQWSSVDIFLLTPLDIQNYFLFLIDQGHPHSYVLQSQSSLSIFFSWCKLKNIILVNPCEGRKLKNPTGRLTICDEHTVSKLMSFIKNPLSDPEQAFLLALILVWGLKSEDLSFAKIEMQDNDLKIILKRKKLGNVKYYNRNQVLEFPKDPQWFYSLLKNFYEQWLIQFNQLKKSYPNYYLMLPRYRSVQPLSKGTIQARVYEATVAAVGKKIPPKVLRKTCGDLHSSSSDASVLSVLGWSSDYCFRYTWLPRSYFQNFKK
jgi:hypothetical protein